VKTKTLAAGIASSWYDCRPFSGRDLAVKTIVGAGAGAVLETSNDDSLTKVDDVSTAETYVANTTNEKALNSPLPSFIRIRNTGGGTVKFSIGPGVNSRGEPCEVTVQSYDIPTTGAFSV
jgi:hypothetical protein